MTASTVTRLGPRRCWCCGEEHATSGCVRGPRCQCGWLESCHVCYKCPLHCNCTQEELEAKAAHVERVGAHNLAREIREWAAKRKTQ